MVLPASLFPHVDSRLLDFHLEPVYLQMEFVFSEVLRNERIIFRDGDLFDRFDAVAAEYSGLVPR